MTPISNSAPPSKPTSPKHHITTSQGLDAPQIKYTGHQSSDYDYDWAYIDDRTNVDLKFETHANGGTQSHTCMDYDFSLETTREKVNQDDHQLQLWAYETSNANITVAERLEKANWGLKGWRSCRHQHVRIDIRDTIIFYD